MIVLTLKIGGITLTCIEDSILTCDPNVLEEGKPTCRLIGWSIIAALEDESIRKVLQLNANINVIS
jgi:hypothetical protein